MYMSWYVGLLWFGYEMPLKKAPVLEKIDPILEKWLDPKNPEPINAFTSCWLCNLMAVLENRGSREVGPG